jgi:hypothetical protein
MAIQFDYKTGIKRQIVNSLMEVFDEDFSIPELRGRVKVSLDYPMEPLAYPAVYVTYQEDVIRNAGIGHIEYVENPDSIFPKEMKHWIFSGRINFNIIALNPYDRDRLASAVINAIAFGELPGEFNDFWTQLRGTEYVYLQPLTDEITPGGEQIGQVPWGDDDELQFGNSYSIPVFGEFYSRPETGELIQINEVDLYPYRLGEQDPP